ncbi:leukocyte receptor cluster member 1 homolog [Leptidea sinapis]|uniref:leukocyte receptor cluster member 1 homolog n=1 Tax=Leptidea sinapis TaxID=189913 RepID=UPI00213562F2|nr:leukocyte receptor cluster member 1 homolog [Leptidea sinapis]XP_050664501.1 leukocyte receptor cluster member 1 homolog [Leptidea sinapis]
MNILPKKRWHVRTKENIARVRKDEAEAAEKARQEQLRTDQADRELRLNILKQKSKEKLEHFNIPSVSHEDKPNEHINLFSDIEHAVTTTNAEHDKEVKDKKEEYEKKIGYLTYLGQDTNEALQKKNWYEVPPESSRHSRPDYIKDTYDKLVLKDADGKPKIKSFDEKNNEIDWRAKQKNDPLNSFRHLTHTTVGKLSSCSNQLEKPIKNVEIIPKKSIKNKSSDKELKLQKLREARLKREQQEKYKTEIFLRKLNGEPLREEREKSDTKMIPKYNSQFNPELARQNYR